MARLADANSLIGALIEEEEGVANFGEILTVEGLDMINLSSEDYSCSLGVPGQRNPKIIAAQKKIVDATKKKGLIQRTRLNWRDALTDPEKMKEQVKEGLRNGVYVFGISQELSILREVIGSIRKILDTAWEEHKAELAS